MSKKEFLTDEQVEAEIARLSSLPEVKLAKYEERLRYRRRQYMYKLRGLEKQGKALMMAGIDRQKLDEIYKTEENM